MPGCATLHPTELPLPSPKNIGDIVAWSLLRGAALGVPRMTGYVGVVALLDESIDGD